MGINMIVYSVHERMWSMNLFIMQKGEKAECLECLLEGTFIQIFLGWGEVQIQYVSGYVCKNKICNDAVNAAESILLVKILIYFCPVSNCVVQIKHPYLWLGIFYEKAADVEANGWARASHLRTAWIVLPKECFGMLIISLFLIKLQQAQSLYVELQECLTEVWMLRGKSYI